MKAAATHSMAERKPIKRTRFELDLKSFSSSDSDSVSFKSADRIVLRRGPTSI